MLAEDLCRQGRFVWRLESLQTFCQLSPSFLEQSRVYVDFLIFIITVTEGVSWRISVVFFPLFNVGIFLHLASLHELFQVKLVSFAHLWGFFHANCVWRKVRVLADYARILRAFSIFIGHRVLQVLGLHGLFALVNDGGGQHGGLPLQGRSHHSIKTTDNLQLQFQLVEKGPPFLLFYL